MLGTRISVGNLYQCWEPVSVLGDSGNGAHTQVCGPTVRKLLELYGHPSGHCWNRMVTRQETAGTVWSPVRKLLEPYGHPVRSVGTAVYSKCLPMVMEETGGLRRIPVAIVIYQYIFIFTFIF